MTEETKDMLWGLLGAAVQGAAKAIADSEMEEYSGYMLGEITEDDEACYYNAYRLNDKDEVRKFIECSGVYYDKLDNIQSFPVLVFDFVNAETIFTSDEMLEMLEEEKRNIYRFLDR